MMTPRYLTDVRHGISSQAILKFQSKSLLLYHMTSNLSGENLRPNCIALVSIFFNAVVICLYNMSPLMCLPNKHRAYCILGKEKDFVFASARKHAHRKNIFKNESTRCIAVSNMQDYFNFGPQK